MKLPFLLLAGLSWLAITASGAESQKPPVRIAIIGASHDHINGFIPRLREHSEIELAGIVEPNHELAAACARRFELKMNLFFDSLESLLAHTQVQAVATFTSTFEHQRVVETCAAHGIHVMVEKPLAVNLEQARAIEAAAKRGGIQVVVNYETTWYPANQAAYAVVHQPPGIGELRKIVVHDGHRGPREIGCSEAFLQWLTDPVLNGGGALTDFGCYGADLITWLLNGQRPTSVMAVTQHFKPEVYPKVEDEATILLTYPGAQGIIQASWNWPFDRKDMEIYGRTGYVLVPRSDLMRVRKQDGVETNVTASPLAGPQADSLAYLGAVARGELRPSGLSSLELNMVVTEILDAARESARTGKRIDLPQ
jgi:predicted dehydrogenase